MRITKCDFCQEEIDNKHPACPKKFEGQGTMKIGKEATYNFLYELTITNFQFNTTGIDICKACIIEGIKNGKILT